MVSRIKIEPQVCNCGYCSVHNNPIKPIDIPAVCADCGHTEYQHDDDYRSWGCGVEGCQCKLTSSDVYCGVTKENLNEGKPM